MNGPPLAELIGGESQAHFLLASKPTILISFPFPLASRE
jgi:hypothetical protein